MKSIHDEKIDTYLKTVADEMSFGEARLGVQRELAGHIEEHIQIAKSYGRSDSDAVEEALKRMGSAKELGVQLNQIHQPKFDLFLLLAAIGLSGVGLWNLFDGPWVQLQLLWVIIGIVTAVALYLLPIRQFKIFLTSLYGISVFGLLMAHISGVVADGQPYLSFAGLNIKMVDLAGTLFALSFPAIASGIRKSSVAVVLFLIPISYFSLNGFIWPGILFFISGLTYLSFRKDSIFSFVSVGGLGAALIAWHFTDRFIAFADAQKSMMENAHTDYALHSLNTANGLQILTCSLFAALAVYGFRLCINVKDPGMRAIATSAISLMAVQIFTSVLASIGLLPMVEAGLQVPFLSYGGSGIVGNFLVLGTLLACQKRKSITIG